MAAVRRDGDRNGGNSPLAIFGIIFSSSRRSSARLMQAAVSRRREALADVSGVQMTRYPPGLISALEKLRADTTVVALGVRATAHLWIEQPMSGVGDEGKFGSLQPPVRHPPAAGRAHRRAPGALRYR